MMSKFATEICVRNADLLNIKSSSRGNQSKYVTIINNRRVWVKTDCLGYEGASEVVASRVARCTNFGDYFPIVDYYPCKVIVDNNVQFIRTGCYSYDFRGTNVKEITLERICKQNFNKSFYTLRKQGASDMKQFYANLLKMLNIPFLADYLTMLLQFDALIYNEDRHTHNIEFLQDTNGLHPAPLFDNGAAFFSDLEYDYPINASIGICKKRVKAKPFINSFDKQVKLMQTQSNLQLSIRNPFVKITDLRDYYDEKVILRISQVLSEKGFKVS